MSYRFYYSVMDELGLADLEVDLDEVEEIEEISDELKDFFIPKRSTLKETEDSEALISHVKYSWSNIIGAPMSGKTSLALTIAHDVEKYYTKHGLGVHTVVTPLLADGIQKLPKDTQIAVIIVDDALLLSFASGRQRADIMNVGAYAELRHLLLRRCPHILFADVMYTVQRFKSLDIVFRSASRLTIFKTADSDPDDNKIIRNFLGRSELMKILLMITEGLYRYHKTEYAKYFVYATAWGTRNVVSIPKVKQPQNLTVSKELREMLLAEFMKPTPQTVKTAVKIIIAHLASMGTPWSNIQTKVLKTIRKWGLKIDNNLAHDIWKRYFRTGMTAEEILERS